MRVKTLSLSKSQASQLQLLRWGGILLLLAGMLVAARLQQRDVVMVRVNGVEQESHIVSRGPGCASTTSNEEFEKLMRDLPVRGYLAK